MSKRFAGFVTALTVLNAAAVCLAQQPRVVNGRVATQAAAALPQSLQGVGTAHPDGAWVGYGVPLVAGEHRMCCSNGDSNWNGCGLEPSRGPLTTTGAVTPAGPVKLEGPTQLFVLFRVAGPQIERVRVFSEDCDLDAGGKDLVWLTGVRPADSIAFLESLVVSQTTSRDRIGDSAITAIALHGDAAADASLERLLATSQPSGVRSKVPFWLGNARGRRGLELLRRTLKDDPSADVKKKAVFGVSQSREPQAVELLIDSARSHPETAVRGEAIFWLGQKAGSKAAATISERIAQDPDTEVKKRAVFALSQLPASEGVPLLIDVARKNPNPAVKKQAMFWLGQSKDPRAIDFFAEVLK